MIRMNRDGSGGWKKGLAAYGLACGLVCGLVCALGGLLGAAGCESAPKKPAGVEAARPGAPGTGAKTVPAKNYTERVVLSEMRERALGLIETGSRDPSPEVRANAVEASQKVPVRAEPILAAALKDESAAVRTVAAMNVGRLKLKALVAATRPLLDDPSGYCRAAAIYAMQTCGEPVDLSPLSSMLLSDPSARLCSHAAFILGEIGNPTALPMLRQAAHDGVPRALQSEERLFQLQVAEAMVKLGDRQTINAIYAALYPSRPEDLEGSALAAQILGQLRDKSSIDRLINVAEYRNQQGQHYSAEVRLAAATALGRLGIVRGGFIADEFWTSEMAALRAQSAFAYGEIGTPDSLAHLDVLLGDADQRVRIAAAFGVLNIVDTLGGPRTHNTATR